MVVIHLNALHLDRQPMLGTIGKAKEDWLSLIYLIMKHKLDGVDISLSVLQGSHEDMMITKKDYKISQF